MTGRRKNSPLLLGAQKHVPKIIKIQVDEAIKQARSGRTRRPMGETWVSR